MARRRSGNGERFGTTAAVARCYGGFWLGGFHRTDASADRLAISKLDAAMARRRPYRSSIHRGYRREDVRPRSLSIRAIASSSPDSAYETSIFRYRTPTTR